MLREIARHFLNRRTEWALSGILILFGLILLLKSTLFQANPAYGALARIADQTTWASVTLTMGVLRVIILASNGSIQGFKWSAHARVTAAIVSATIWLQLCIGFLCSGQAATGLATYPFLVLLDIANAYCAATETHRKKGS